MVIKSTNGKEKLEVETIRISCKSDNYKQKNRYAFCIVYHLGESFNAKKRLGRNIRPGYVIIKNTEDGSEVMNDPTQDNSRSHGKLMHWYFGVTTQELVETYQGVFGGAGVMPNQNTGDDDIIFGSLNLNVPKKDKTGTWTSFHDGKKEANDHEKALMVRIIRGWMKGKVKRAKNYTYAEIMAMNEMLEKQDHSV